MRTAFIFAISFFSLFVQAQETCDEVTNPVPYKFCIVKTPGSSNTDVLYYLHGGGGNEHTGQSVIDGLTTEWASQKHEAPVIVTISFGKLWLLVGRNGSPNSGLLETFLDSIIPEMERRAVGGPARRRLLAGYSMGGFNAAQVLFNAPPDHFAKAALVCPAIIDLSPWAPEEDLVSHADYLGIPLKNLKGLLGVVRNYVDNEDFYSAEVDPIALSKTRLQKVTTSILVATNKDDMAFYDGGEKFSRAAVSSNALITSQTWAGAHCDTDTQKLGDFLR